MVIPASLPLSVVLCTYNRAPLLAKALASLVGQTLDRNDFEVVLIDNGSSDGTKQVAESFADRLPLRYFFQHQFGLAAGRNHGACAARGDLLLFLDDDDIATPTLLEEHVQAHRQYPDPRYAVLNYTGWAPGLRITPLMKFVTEVECHLFCYPGLRHGAVLDYNYFWGGRTSCKKQFLMEHGLFNPLFQFGCEDVELGYRLSHYGLRVVYNAKAINLMARTVDLAGFCDRLVQQGRAQSLFAAMHDTPAVRNWTNRDGDAKQWSELSAAFADKFRAVSELDRQVNERIELGSDPNGDTLASLHQGYRWIIRACKLKGMAEQSALAPPPGKGTQP